VNLVELLVALSPFAQPSGSATLPVLPTYQYRSLLKRAH